MVSRLPTTVVNIRRYLFKFIFFFFAFDCFQHFFLIFSIVFVIIFVCVHMYTYTHTQTQRDSLHSLNGQKGEILDETGLITAVCIAIVTIMYIL